MSTAEYPDALTRRLALLAAASGDEPDGESSAVAALVRGLRAEIGGVRADLGSLRSETGAALESRLAALEDALDGTSERIEALARDGASTTTDRLVSLEAGVAAFRRTVEADGQAAAEERAAMTELASSVRTALDGFSAVLDRSVAGLAARLAALETTVGESRTDVTGRVGDLHEVVARGAGATQEALTWLSALSSSTDALADTVDGFRTEWPTRTHEVVRGAEAVADGVVREVRAEVGVQLERVQRELERAVGGLDAARAGLDAGTDRPSPAELPEEVGRADPAPRWGGESPVLEQTPAPPTRVRAVDGTTSRVALPRVAATRGASGTSVTVRPTVGPATPAAGAMRPAEPRSDQPRPSGADRRARVDVMPQVRSPRVALEAAAPTPPAGADDMAVDGADDGPDGVADGGVGRYRT